MIYFVEAIGTGMVKVGYAVDTAKRVALLQCATPIRLRVLDTVEGTRRDEADAHRALGKHSVGEWFPRKDAVDLLRAIRRSGLSACGHFERWRDNEKRARSWRNRFSRKASDLTARWISAHTLATVPHDQMARVTGASVKTWRRGASGQTVPSLHHILNSLRREPRHLSNLSWAVSRQVIRPILSELGAIVEEADRIKLGDAA